MCSGFFIIELTMFHPNKYKLNLWKKSYLYVYQEWEKMKVGNFKSSFPSISIARLSHDIEAASVDNPGYVATSSWNKMADKVCRT